MARSKGRSGGTPSRSGDTDSRAAAAPVVDEIEIVEEEAGFGIGDGLAFATFLMLLAAFIAVDYARGMAHGEGMLFKGKYEAPEGASAGADS